MLSISMNDIFSVQVLLVRISFSGKLLDLPKIREVHHGPIASTLS